MIICDDIIQQSEQWFRLRAGRPTASQFDRIFTAGGKDSAKSTWENYALELCAECIRPDELAKGWTGNQHTDRGNELEPEAREEFVRRTGLHVRQVGFVTRDDGVVGCSPDGLIVDASGQWEAGLEIKCPSPAVHARYLLGGELPAEHKQQVHGGMAVTGLSQWHFMSYCPGFRPLWLIAKRDAYTEALSKAIDRFVIFYSKRRGELMPLLLEKNTQKTTL